MKKICFIANRYPTDEYPVNTFLDQLVCEMADQGIECTVIAPYSRIYDRLKRFNYHPQDHYVRQTSKGSKTHVYCPTIFALSGKRTRLFDFAASYQLSFTQAVRRTIEKHALTFDAFYGHFITPGGFAAIDMGCLFEKPSFIAYGESSIKQDTTQFTLETIRKKLSSVQGIVSVSTKNKEELIDLGLVPAEKIGVFPNAISTDSFYQIDRMEARKRLGMDQNQFIIAFVGQFIDRKGCLRVADAVSRVDGVFSLFIGAGEQDPQCPGILFKGRLPHKDIVTYLNAANAFVLPTKAEGCCNAIVEAMACGLPVISSDLPFNDDILDESNSIRICPTDVDGLAQAIRTLKENRSLRERLSEGALLTSHSLTIGTRTTKIRAFMEGKL